MKMKTYGSGWLLSALLPTLFLASAAQSQTAPDAGSLLREQPKPPAPISAPALIRAPESSVEGHQEAGPKVLVRGFRFEGAVLIAASELSRMLGDNIGKELSLRQLQALTARITAYYGERGYLARAILPPQEIKDGVVVFHIVEGRRGNLSFQTKGDRLPEDWVKRLVENRLGSSEYLDLAQVGEVGAILKEQPGLGVEIELLPGRNEGEVSLGFDLKDKPMVSATLGANNQASRSTGEYQAQGSLTLNNPSGLLDAATLLATATEGNTYVRGDYSLPVGAFGLRFGVNASTMSYHVVQAGLKALRSRGTADTYGLNVSYPLFRRQELQLTLTAGMDNKELVDRTIAGETGNRGVRVTTLGFNGSLTPNQDSFLGGGETSFGASVSLGNSHQRNAAAQAADAAARRVEGDYDKIAYSLGHLRPLGQEWSLNAILRGQFAGKNLDSSERFSLGGASGVRAYPVGEGTGDEGWLLNLNFQRLLADKLAATLFLDAGGITVNRNLYAGWNAGNPRLTNRYELAGIGAGLDWRLADNVLLNATLASPLGSNPGRDTNNKNADGRKDNMRVWLSLNAQF
ncbi:MAG: hypothetical protein M0P39_16015 [Rhodocyclaceae bacterium]|nr:hypothetical protein [Rhodocyclaceae bacterium]